MRSFQTQGPVAVPRRGGQTSGRNPQNGCGGFGIASKCLPLVLYSYRLRRRRPLRVSGIEARCLESLVRPAADVVEQILHAVRILAAGGFARGARGETVYGSFQDL